MLNGTENERRTGWGDGSRASFVFVFVVLADVVWVRGVGVAGTFACFLTERAAGVRIGAAG
jgi:hypothetical protein